MDQLAATITIERNSTDDVQQRQIYISLDGERVAELMYGDTFARDVPPGTHYLRAYNTLVWKTLTCTLLPGERAEFRVVNRPGPGTTTMLALFGSAPIYLTFERAR